jgi:hypothetical protein
MLFLFFIFLGWENRLTLTSNSVNKPLYSLIAQSLAHFAYCTGGIIGLKVNQYSVSSRVSYLVFWISVPTYQKWLMNLMNIEWMPLKRSPNISAI